MFRSSLDIQKQLLAYGGDDSEETRATLQKLNTDLIAAQKDLQETEYDKYISDQENLLDQFYSDLEEWMNGRMDELSGGPGLLFAGRFLITVSISVLVMSLLIFSISSWSIFGKL